MRAESAETKVAAESRFAEAHIMIEDAQKKFTEAEAKFHTAKSLQAESSLFQRTAERKLQEVEAREDDLSRRIVLFKNEYVIYIAFSFFMLFVPSFSFSIVSLFFSYQFAVFGHALISQEGVLVSYVSLCIHTMWTSH